MNTKQIYDKLIEAKQAYYDGEPIMSDADFDALEDQLRDKDPNHEYFKIVGSTNNKQKVQHTVPMLSSAKAKTVEEAVKWIDKIGCGGELFQVEPKIDGLSCTVKYKNGKLSYIATRGDGKFGQDITHIGKWVKIPTKIDLSQEVEVRGELFIPKNSCPNPENKPLRNMAVGFINRKDDGLEDLKYVKFIAYEVVGGGFTTESSKLAWIKANKFSVIDDQFTFNSQEKLDSIYAAYLKTYRDQWEYETDGIMIVLNDINQHAALDARWDSDHHHHYNLALKGISEKSTTILIDIEWNVSRQGKLIPVAIFKPVVLGSVNISRASLSNYETVVRMKLTKGDTIEVSRSNDVIPYIVSNISKGISQKNNV